MLTIIKRSFLELFEGGAGGTRAEDVGLVINVKPGVFVVVVAVATEAATGTGGGATEGVGLLPAMMASRLFK